MLRRLPLTHAVNVRDLGGYPIPGGCTKYRSFVRSAELCRLTEEEIKYLLDYGVNTVVDLRNDVELRHSPHNFAGIAGVAYHHAPLMADIALSERESNEQYLRDAYLQICAGRQMSDALKIIAAAPPGVVLFNCSAGKDRTGVLAAVLLLLAGVDKYDIIADYQVSSTYFSPVAEMLYRQYPDMPLHLMRSDPQWMADLLGHIERTYGGTAGYTRALGLTDAETAAIAGRLTGGCVAV